MSESRLTKTVVYKGNVYPAGTPASDIDGASDIGADVWDGKATSVGSTGYDSQQVKDLQKEADARRLEVTGTGKDGKVVKADLVAALEADDAAANGS